MAEKENKQQSHSVNEVPKGLSKDFAAQSQPKGTYRFALNAVGESKEGDQGFLTNEEGNYQCVELEENYWIPIGHVYLSNDSAIVFLANTDPTFQNYGRIVKIDRECNLTIYLTSNCLNFRVVHQIDAEYRVRNGCETVLYFTDDYNDIRCINIDSLTDYLKEGATYSTTDPDIWDCENFKFFPDFTIPQINYKGQNSGGDLDAGVYQFAIRYLDNDGNPTNWFSITQPIPVIKDALTNVEFDMKGEYTQTTTLKAINLEFTNVDTSFGYIEIAVLPSTVGTGIINGPVYIIDKVAISDPVENYTFSTLNTDSAILTSLADIIIDRTVYNTAKSIKQLQNRLILGNLRGAEVDLNYARFQQYACDSRVQYITGACSTEDANDTSVQGGEYYYEFRTFMRDEVYALAVVWVFKDGTRSPAFHLPGREKNKQSADPGTIGAFYPNADDPNNPDTPNPAEYTMAETHRILPTVGWDSSNQNTIPFAIDANDPNQQHYDINPIGSGLIQRWEIYNTAVRTFQTALPLASGEEFATQGDCGYYETRQYEYPDIDDCNGGLDSLGNPMKVYAKYAFPPIGAPILIEDLSGTPVRHHRMPDTTLEPHFYGDTSITYGDMFPAATLASGNQPYAAGEGARVISLGVRVSLAPPPEYADLLQGFYIVRAQRDNKDKSVFDKGIMFFNHEGYVAFRGNSSQGSDIDNCHFMFQGGQGNKQLNDAACVHYSWEDTGGTVACPACDYPLNDISAPGYDLANSPHLSPNGWFPSSGALKNCNQCWQGSGRPRKQFANCLTNNEGWDDPSLYNPPPQIGSSSLDNNANFGNGYPISFDNSNVGESFDNFVTILSNVAYHGPMTKFSFVEDPIYMKFERVLTGYTSAIICASACCDNDTGAQANLDGDGIGIFDKDRADCHTTFILDKFTFHQSSVPYRNVQSGISGGNPGFPDGGTPDWLHTTNFTGAQYREPLYNVSIQDSVMIGLDAVVSMTTFDDIFDNFQGQELLAIQTKKLGAAGTLHYKIPYPGNNGAVTPIEDDNSYSRGWCSDLLSSPFNPTGVDAHKGRSTAYYIALKKNSYDAFGALGSLKYQSTNTNIGYMASPDPSAMIVTKSLYGGDSFVSRFSFRRTQWAKRCGKSIAPVAGAGGTPDSSQEDCSSTDPDDWSGSPPFRYVFPDSAGGVDVGEKDSNTLAAGQDRALLNNNIIWYWTESFINTELRNGRDTINERFYPYFFEGTSLLGPYSFVDSENVYDGGIPTCDGTGDALVPDKVIEQQNYYNVNPDYLKECVENVYFPVPVLFDYCNDCREDFPTRIAYSEQSFQEGQVDTYKQFLANNYRDIPGNRGEIWNLFTLNNSLYIQTEESLWKVLPSTQMTTLDDTNVYIGTGEFFSNPPLEILESETGYMGSQSQWACVISENGMFWPDARQGKVFAFSSKPEDYSIKGLRNWFENNMRMNIYDQYLEIFGVPFPAIDTPAAPHGAGYLGVYDPRHSRYILTKKDYKLKPPFNTTDPADPFYQRVSFNEVYGVWQVQEHDTPGCSCYSHDWIAYDQNGGPAGPPVLGTVDPADPSLCLYSWIQFGTGIAREYREDCSDRFLTNWRDGWGAGPCMDTVADGAPNEIDTVIGVYESDVLIFLITNLNDVFECKSWTISYSIIGSSWTSWHSYTPSYYIGTKNFFWSGVNAFSITHGISAPTIPSYFWRHQLTPVHDNYQTYYGKLKPHIIELISNENPLQVTVGDYYHFITDAWKFDETTQQYLEVRYTTFDKAYLYNSYHL
jgi:hypothetical protein